MKFVIFSDIHGNTLALKECIKEIEKMEVDAIIWCGDYITDFPESHEVMNLGTRSEIISKKLKMILERVPKFTQIHPQNHLKNRRKYIAKSDMV